ncbi:MAG TPA: ribokinase [Candidatus Nanopelagicaceae bacterium]|nr:ribokinase [Candidatus Nanopelagicaceae bacterium]
MSATVAVFGSFMMDLIAYAPRRPVPGETLRGDSFATALGGKGFNQVVAASRAGVSARMLGRVGTDDFGDLFIQALSDEQILLVGVERDRDAGTGVGLPVVESGGENSIIIVPRANDGADHLFVERHKGLIQSSNVLLLQLELPVDGALAAARIAKEVGVRVVLNPAPATSVAQFSGLVDVIVPNEVEFAALAGEHGSMIERAVKLHDRLSGCDVVITRGSQGAYVLDGDHLVTIPAPTVTAIDTIGAGDTLCGYLAARLALGDTLIAATRMAIVAASISVTRRGGAQSSPVAEEVLRFMAENRHVSAES